MEYPTVQWPSSQVRWSNFFVVCKCHDIFEGRVIILFVWPFLACMDAYDMNIGEETTEGVQIWPDRCARELCGNLSLAWLASLICVMVPTGTGVLLCVRHAMTILLFWWLPCFECACVEKSVSS